MTGRSLLLARPMPGAVTGCALDPLVKPAMPEITVWQRQPGPVALLIVNPREPFRSIRSPL